MTTEISLDSKRTRGKNLDTDLPNTNLENLKSIIIAFYKLNATKESVTTNKLSSIISFSRDVASKQMRFFVSIELIRKEGRGYMLSEQGDKYARFLDWGQIEEANKILSDLFKKSSTINTFLLWLDTNKEPVPREEAIRRLGIIANVPSHRNDLRLGMESIFDWLLEAGNIFETENHHFSTYKSYPMENDNQKHDEILKTKQDPNEIAISINLNLNFTIDDKFNLENFKTTIEDIQSIIKKIKSK